MTVAFVLSGGASLGSIQVGMLAALAENGIKPDLLVGTSAGAINAAWVAGHPDDDPLDQVEGLAPIWRSLRRSRVFPVAPLGSLLGLVGRRNHLVDPGPLRRLLAEHIPFERLEDAAVELHVVTTEVLSGAEVVLSQGPAVDAVMASAAIPAVFPPVVLGSEHLMDGGVSNNAPISHALRAGADEVYVLATGHACALAAVPSTALGIALQSLTTLISRQLVVDVDRYEQQCTLHVVPPLCPQAVSPADFGHADQLIERALESTRTWLLAGHPDRGQASLLAAHRH